MTWLFPYTRLAAPSVGLLVLVGATGCVLTPKGTTEERDRAADVAQQMQYDVPVEKRALPDLPDPATWRDALHHAFYANGELESRYFEWRSALHRIDVEAGFPTSNVELGFDWMFDSQRMKSFDRLTVSAGFDETVTFPSKVAVAGRIALAEARTAGDAFAATKFELQRTVLSTYLKLALVEEQIRLESDNVELLDLLTTTARDRLAAGGAQQDLLKAQIAYRLAQNELGNLQSRRASLVASLNGQMGRAPGALLRVPASLPEARVVPVDDATILASATDLNPELAGLAQQVSGRADALELARMAYIPDFNPTAAFTGSVAQSIGAMVMLPTTFPQIRATIRAARDDLSAARATLRQAQRDRAARFVASLVAMRNAERQTELLNQQILPLAQQALAASRQSYATGTVGFADLIDAQRTLIDVRYTLAEARVERETQLAELEALAGTDVEALARPTPIPSTLPE